MGWILKRPNLLEGQRYLRYLSLACLVLFLLIGFLLWYRLGDASFYNFQNHLLQKCDDLDFRLSMLKSTTQRLDRIFDQPSSIVDVSPKPQPVRILLDSVFGVLDTHQALDKPATKIFAQFKEYAPFFLRSLYKQFPDVERIYFVSSAISFMAPFPQKNTPSDINDKNYGLTSYNYEILSRLSSYFTGWSSPSYHGQSWHVRYIHPCYNQHTLLGFFAVHIGPSFLKRYLRTLMVPFGHVLLVAENGDILLEKSTRGFGQPKKLPEKMTSYVRQIILQKDNYATRTAPYRINVMNLKSGPWKLCFVTTSSSLLRRTMGPISLLFLWSDLIYVAIGLLALLGLNAYLVHVGFIHPMRMIINHINQERLNLQTNLFRFEQPWRHWAQLISASFVEKRNRSARLENTLKERMGDLSQMMDYLKKNQYQLISGERLMSLGGTAIGVAYEMRGFLAYISNLLKHSPSITSPNHAEILIYVNRCNNLLKDVLICGYGGDDAFAPVDLNELLKRYVKLSTFCFFSKNGPVPVLVDIQLPSRTLTCFGIEHQLGAAVFSLVSQALESAFFGYTNAPDVLPSIEVELVVHDYNCAIHIKDTGPFLGKKTQEELLEGLGTSGASLQTASCLSIIQGHDGTIFFSEEQENHTTVILPLHKPEAQSKSA